jgi:tetratricopeptide (TPR) repeat protein
VRHSLDYLSLGRALERCGEIDSALACYEAGLAGELELDHRAEGLTRLAALHKRERRWEAALVLWDKLVDLGGPSALVALIERAKYYEHVERMFLEALEDTQHALNLLELMPGQVEPSVRVDLERRQARVLNRVYRDRAWTQAR